MARVFMRLHFNATYTAAVSIPGAIKKFLEDNYGIGSTVTSTNIVEVLEDAGFQYEEEE